jgi:TonB family protein
MYNPKAMKFILMFSLLLFSKYVNGQKYSHPGSARQKDENSEPTDNNRGKVNSPKMDLGGKIQKSFDLKKLMEIKTPDELYIQFGAENVNKENFVGLEDDFRTGENYVVYPNTSNEIVINLKQRFIRLTKENSKWKMPYNLRIGEPIEEVIKINGRDFIINGFETDYGGEVDDWENGHLETVASLTFKVTNRIGTDVNGGLFKLNKINTSNPIVKQLKLKIEEIVIPINKMNNGDKITANEKRMTLPKISYADSNETELPTSTKVITAENEPQQKAVFTWVEQMPQFPGGYQECEKYINANLRYPDSAKKEGIEGRVIVKMIIEANGEVSDAEVVRGVGGGLDEEAIRLVKNMPKWQAGKQNGRNVAVYYTLPIMFKLD